MKTNQEIHNELQSARFIATCFDSIYKKPCRYLRQLIVELETELKLALLNSKEHKE